MTAHTTTIVDPALTGWVDWLVRRQLSPLTMDAYVGTVTRWLDKHADWQTATTEQIERWCSRPRPRTRHPKPSTINRDMAALSSFYKWAHSRGHVAENATVGAVTPRIANANPHPPDDNVWVDTWEHANPIAQVGLGLGYYVGLRRTEITTLRWEHVDLERQRLVDFPRKGGGTDVMPYGTCIKIIATKLPHLVPGGTERFHTALAEAHEAAQQRPSRTMLPVGADEKWFYRAVYKWQADAGHPNTFSPHALRHGFVTNLLRAGVPIHLVSRMANHGSIETTMRYVKAAGEELTEWLDQES